MMGKSLSLQELCTELKKEQLLDLVMHLSNQYEGIDTAVMEWYASQKRVGKKEAVSNHLLWEYWERAEEIIQRFNEYGGGPEHLAYDVYEYVRGIIDLLSEYPISSEERRLLIKRLYVQYELGNSGLNDIIMDTIYEICQSDSDWKYVIKLLGKSPDEYDQKLIMKIYKEQLQDGEAYLELRLKMLEYGMDYWDLAEYYISMNQLDKAVEIAETGLENGKGRLTELFAFVFEYYAEREETDHIQDLVEQAFHIESDVDMISKCAVQYFKKKNEYEKIKSTLVKAFRINSYHKEYYADFNTMKEQLTVEDWEKIQEEMIEIVKKESVIDYLKICYDHEMYNEMLAIISKSPRTMYEYNLGKNLDPIADQLIDKYPQKIVEYYWNKGGILILEGNRKRYKEAVKHLKKVKDILENKLQDKEAWEFNLKALKEHHKKKKALLDELKVFE
ncbi:hypothetical protein [Bacillus fungorum]|uniref:hypothetical protein n=1 Tax=Bacillus fungorum TaxID=2039284 RepID=UPI003F548778